MIKSLCLLLLTGICAVNTSFSQERYTAFFHSASKHAAQDYRRVLQVLTAKGDLENKELIASVESKLAAHESDTLATEWSAYLYQLQIPDTLRKDGFEQLKNLKHNGAHTLGDILLSKKQYKDAIAYFQDALKYPYYSFGAINMVKDEINLSAKLIACYEKLGDTTAIYTTGLPVILSNVKLGKETIVEKQLIRLAANDKATIKMAIDQGLAQVKSLTRNSNENGEQIEETFYSFMFREQPVTVLYYGGSAQSFMTAVRNTSFYKSLL